MSAKTNIWLASASALVLLAGPALAQNNENVTIVKPDGPAEQAGEAVDNAAAATVETTQDAAQATGNAVENAADATGDAVENAADATADAAEDTADAADNAMDNATTAETTTTTTTPAPAATADADVETTDMDDQEVAEGTPIEGQIFEQSADTFLASTLLDSTVINPAGDKIGDVNDLVMTSEGSVEGVLIGVGGFLGIGEKEVAIELGRIDITQDEDGDLAFQLDATKEELEAAPEFKTQDDMESEAAASAAGSGAATGMGTPAPATSTN